MSFGRISFFAALLMLMPFEYLTGQTQADPTNATNSTMEISDPPALISSPMPAYPKGLHAAGTVIVSVNVNESGAVTAAKAISGNPLFYDSAVSAAKGAKFVPLAVNGKPRSYRTRITYLFTAPDEKPIQTTVCEILRQPQKYNHKKVEIQGSVETDYMHSTLLIDKNCPSRGLSIYPGKGDQAESSDEELGKALDSVRHNPGKNVSGGFTGRLILQPKASHPRKIFIEKITDLKID